MKASVARKCVVGAVLRENPGADRIEVDGQVLYDRTAGKETARQQARQAHAALQKVEASAEEARRPSKLHTKAAAWVLSAIPYVVHLIERGVHVPIALVKEQGKNLESTRRVDRVARSVGTACHGAKMATLAVFAGDEKNRSSRGPRAAARAVFGFIGRGVARVLTAQPELSNTVHDLRVSNEDGSSWAAPDVRVNDVSPSLWNKRITVAAYGVGANLFTPGSGAVSFGAAGTGRLLASAVFAGKGDLASTLSCVKTAGRDALLAGVVYAPMAPFTDHGVSVMMLAAAPHGAWVDPLMGYGVAREGSTTAKLARTTPIVETGGEAMGSVCEEWTPDPTAEIAARAIMNMFKAGRPVGAEAITALFNQAPEGLAPELDLLLAREITAQMHSPAAERLFLKETFALAQAIQKMPAHSVPESSAAIYNLVQHRLMNYYAARRPIDVEAIVRRLREAAVAGEGEKMDAHYAELLDNHLDRAPKNRMRYSDILALAKALDELVVAPKAAAAARVLRLRMREDGRAISHMRKHGPKALERLRRREKVWERRVKREKQTRRCMHDLPHIDIPPPKVESTQSWEAQMSGGDAWAMVPKWMQHLTGEGPSSEP